MDLSSRTVQLRRDWAEVEVVKPLKLCLVMFFQYAIVSANFRFVARGSYAGAISTDAVIAMAGWTITKWVVAADTWQERVGYVIGASLGSALGIFLTSMH